LLIWASSWMGCSSSPVAPVDGGTVSDVGSRSEDGGLLGRTDAVVSDGLAVDATPVDAAREDAAPLDTGVVVRTDSGSADASASDIAINDSGAVDGGAVCTLSAMGTTLTLDCGCGAQSVELFGVNLGACRLVGFASPSTPSVEVSCGGVSLFIGTGCAPADAGVSDTGVSDGGVTLGYKLIPAGTFTMGSPLTEVGREPFLGSVGSEVQHTVTITRDYWLKQTEVTQGEFLALMGFNPSGFPACGSSCPVEMVTWYDAVDYVNALSRAEGLPECYGGTGENRTFVGLSCLGYRLPTEAEWEYAARAGTLTSTYNGDITVGETCNADPALSPIAWYCADGAPYSPRPVGGKQPNAWGLYDMLGNVSEWTHDQFALLGAGAVTDPLGSPGGAGVGTPTCRGGSFSYEATFSRAAYRDRANYAVAVAYDLGFRPARSAGP
jgi:formylglycine-generating enzyme required for sulfatase activity